MKKTLLFLFLLSATSVQALDIQSGATPQHSVMADFNQDGRTDLAVANAFDDTVAIHLQDSQGQFPVSQSIPVGINLSTPSNFPRFLVVTDINNDHFPDLVVLCSGQFSIGAEPSIQTLLNDRSGNLVRMPAQSTTPSFASEEFPIQFVQGEFTGDFYPDLALCNLDGKSIRIMEGSGTGVYQIGQEVTVDTGGEGPQDLAVFDGNGDGLDDLWIVTANTFLVIPQSAPGVFASPNSFTLSVSPTALRAVVLDDLDGNGILDAALADSDNRVHLLFNVSVTGSSQFTATMTDPSLSGCSDITTLYWDADVIPDLVVCNRTGNSLTLFPSEDSVQSFPTALSPRRIQTDGDLNGDGVLDLVTANEGDLTDPQNPDVSVWLNPSFPTSSINLRPEGTWSMDNLFDLNVPAAQGLAIPADRERFWMIDASRTSLLETDSNGELRKTIQFPFEIGGVYFKEDHEGYVVEKNAGRIHEFEVEDGNNLELKELKTFSFSPGEPGFSGLAYDESREEFFVSAPGESKVIRLNDDGTILSEFDVSVPAWGLTWDDAQQRLLLVSPGRSDVRAYTRSGTLDSGLSTDLADNFGFFAMGEGLAGVSWYEKDQKTYLLSSSGVLFDWTSGTIVDPVPTSPGGNVLGMDFSANRNELYVLDEGGFFYQMDGGDYSNAEIDSIWPAVSSDPGFVPAGISFDEVADEVLIADRNSVRAARFSRSGNFLGWRDFSSEVGSINGPVLGFDLIDSATGLYLRTPTSLYYGPPGESLPSTFSSDGNLSWGEMGILLLGKNHGEIVYMDPEGSGGLQRIGLEDVQFIQGLAFDSSDSLLVFDSSPTPTLRRLVVETLSANEHWDLYE